MASTKTIKARGVYKTKIHSALFNTKILEVILDNFSTKTDAEKIAGFKTHVKSHLFVDETVVDAGTYVFYDVIIPSFSTRLKDCKIKMWAICHRDIIDTFSKDGYYGNRADILSEMIEEVLLDDSVVDNFGIGKINLESVDIYNSYKFYGTILTFNICDFR